MKKEKIKSIFFWTSLGILSAAAVGSIIYFVVKMVNRNKVNSTQIDDFDWSNFAPGFEDFSKSNSYRVVLQTSSSTSSGFYISQGTAWSLYYEQLPNNSYDWYLMTNFHVVNEAVAYKKGFSSLSSSGAPEINNSAGLLNYYENNLVTNFWKKNESTMFSLSYWNSNHYSTILDSTSRILSSYMSSIDIITDFNNEAYELFSNGSSYNLDTSLIKINISNPISGKTAINVLDNWKKYDEERKKEYVVSETGTLSSNRSIYIAGNPSDAKQLLAVDLSEDWKCNKSHLSGNGDILNKLYAPYYYTNSWLTNFQLSAGASGSAVYRFDKSEIKNGRDVSSDRVDNLTFLNQLVPFGIYWGGTSILSGTQFKPSFIPFYVNGVYNIFDNLESYINSKN